MVVVVVVGGGGRGARISEETQLWNNHPPPTPCHPPPIPSEEFRAGPLLSLSLEWLEGGMRERVGRIDILEWRQGPEEILADASLTRRNLLASRTANERRRR